MCVKHFFTGIKIKENLRTLLARAAFNNEVCLSEAMFSKNVLLNLQEIW